MELKTISIDSKERIFLDRENSAMAERMGVPVSELLG
jgi:hypothetical protein